MTFWTGARLDLRVLGLVERTQHKATLVTVVAYDTELGQDSCDTCNYTVGANELVQVELSVSQWERKENVQLSICG